MFRSFLLILSLSSLAACGQFQTDRTYLSEMEHDDSRFFNPADDFPIVPGDSGKNWTSEKEILERTTASESDLAETRASRALRQELRELESLQSEESKKLYMKHRHHLTTTSEKIYFLKLPYYDRREYLLTRGFISETRAPASTISERMMGVRKQDILLGMSKGEVISSWGKPVRVDVAGNPSNENERWLYNMNGASKFIYFEAGQVQGWE